MKLTLTLILLLLTSPLLAQEVYVFEDWGLYGEAYRSAISPTPIKITPINWTEIVEILRFLPIDYTRLKITEIRYIKLTSDWIKVNKLDVKAINIFTFDEVLKRGQMLENAVKSVRVSHYIQNKDYIKLRAELAGVIPADKVEALVAYLSGSIIFPNVNPPPFYYKVFETVREYPADMGTLYPGEILIKGILGSPDLGFRTVLWEFYDESAYENVRAGYAAIKISDPKIPVALTVGYLHDGRPERLIKVSEGLYDWLCLWFGRNVWECMRYDLKQEFAYWSKLCGGRPIVLSGVFVNKMHSGVSDFNAYAAGAGFSGVIYYVYP